jgi:hypothetical protein
MIERVSFTKVAFVACMGWLLKCSATHKLGNLKRYGSNLNWEQLLSIVELLPGD